MEGTFGLNIGVTNPLIPRFITATYLALDLDSDAVEAERRFARSHYDLAYQPFEAWAGSRDDLVNLLAHVRTASFMMALSDDQDAASFLRPAWDAICKEQPGLSLEYYQLFPYGHPDGL